MDNVLAMVLAGGQGSRLMPLTAERAKPAVPFGGIYRIVDFVLSNFVNSGIYKIKVLTQYKSESLNRHISRGWRLAGLLNHYVELVPAQQRQGPRWYEGSADAIYQNLNLITDEEPEYVAVFSGDHIYKMDVRQMLDAHKAWRADLTVAAIPVPIEEASAFGVIEVDAEWRMVGFEEKPADPRPIPGQPHLALASMGNYIFSADPLLDVIREDAQDKDSAHDFGKSILTRMFKTHQVFVYDFRRNEVPGQPESERAYWRDVGTIASYYSATMDLINVTPEFDLYNRRWPIRTLYTPNPPAKFVHDDPTGRLGIAIQSIVSHGCIISGGRIERSVLSPRVRINSYSHVSDSILFHGVQVGRHARIRRAIIDKHVEIPPGMQIGYDLEQDEARGFTVTPEGIVVIEKGQVLG